MSTFDTEFDAKYLKLSIVSTCTTSMGSLGCADNMINYNATPSTIPGTVPAHHHLVSQLLYLHIFTRRMWTLVTLSTPAVRDRVATKILCKFFGA